VSGYLVGSTAFKAAETGDPRLVGSIPIHLRHTNPQRKTPIGYRFPKIDPRIDPRSGPAWLAWLCD
jgi:hypothetical protein